MRYLVTITLTLALCFAAQGYALRTAGGRFLKSESNFFSSLGRIQAGAQGQADVLLLGSSITGRLPDRAQGYQGFANMGCDGGSAVDALRAIDAGILPTAPIMVVETNTLHLALDDKPTEIGQALRKPWFKWGLKIPAIASYGRPSAYFYSKLLAKRIGTFGAPELDSDLDVTTLPLVPNTALVRPLEAREESLVAEVAAILGRLKARGVHVVFVWLPPARSGGATTPEWIVELARRASVPNWELGKDARQDWIQLTDGVHMAAPSAARTVVSLRKALVTTDQTR